MTLVSDMITDGYRESNLIGLGVVPNAVEAADGLRRLQAIVSGTMGFEVGEPLHDWPVGLNNVHIEPAFYNTWNQELWSQPLENCRILMDSSQAEQVWFPQQPDDGARMAVIDVQNKLATYPLTLQGNGRLIDGETSVVINTDGFTGMWFYRADLAQWVTVTPLDPADQFPFPPEFDDAFVTQLAIRLNPRYGRAMPTESAETMMNALGNLKARYRQRQARPCDIGVLNLSVQVYNTWSNRGRVPYVARTGWMS